MDISEKKQYNLDESGLRNCKPDMDDLYNNNGSGSNDVGALLNQNDMVYYKKYSANLKPEQIVANHMKRIRLQMDND